MHLDKAKLKQANDQLKKEALEFKKKLPKEFTMQQSLGVFGTDQNSAVGKFELLLEFGFIVPMANSNPTKYKISTNEVSRRRILEDNQKVFKRMSDEYLSRIEKSKIIQSIVFEMKIMR